MPSQHFRFIFVLLLTAIAIVGITIFTHRLPNHAPSPASFPSKISSLVYSNPEEPLNEPRRAFVAFLEDFSGANKAEDADDAEEEDAYFTATRVLGYQLMHAPSTRSNTSIPFVVICSEVSERKRNRLKQDGAIVVEVDKIEDPTWLHTRKQWEGVMTKLRVFEQIQYDKLLFVDADMLIVRRMDDIFEDAGTIIQTVDPTITTEPDEASLPSSYMLSAQAQQKHRLHPYPPPATDDWFCSGFFVFAPSLAIFDYYMSIMNLPNRFDPLYPDQNLLNYAHRWDGPMPWTKFNYTWTSTFPTIKEYEMGAASLHEKYWLEEFRVQEYGQDRLGKMWLAAKADMLEFHSRADPNLV